jgi:hypothetical protein
VEEAPNETITAEGLMRARTCAEVGAMFTAAVFWFALIASAATLGQRHETTNSAQEAAQTLRP